MSARFKPLRSWFFALIARALDTDVMFEELDCRGKIDVVIDQAFAECGPEEAIADREALDIALYELRLGRLGEAAIWLERAIPALSTGLGLAQLVQRNAK